MPLNLSEHLEDLPWSSDSGMLSCVVELIPYAVFWKDTRLRYLGCNTEFARLVGLKSPAEIRGLTDLDLPWPEEDAHRLRQADRRVMKDGETLLHMVDTRRAADGSMISVDTSKVAIRDDEGKVMGIVGIYADITQRVKNEAALEEAREHLDLAVDAMDSAMALYDRDERFVLCNPRYLEVLGIEPGTDLVHESYENILTDHALRNPGIGDIEQYVSRRLTELRGRNNEWTLRCGGRTLRVNHSRTANRGIVSVITDLSAIAEAEHEARVARDEAEAASAAKSMFLAKMSHEIRTPMTAIIGFAEVLISEAERGVLTPETALQSLGTIRRNGRGLLDLINDILDLSKVEAGNMEASIEKFAPIEILRNVVQLLTVRAETAGTRLELVSCGPIPIHVHSDPPKLQQILVNLVGNAIKFTPRGKVTVEPRWVPGSGGGRLEIAVRDTGIGMSPEELARIFTPFAQASADTAKDYGGTGLGLAISSRLAELLQGHLSVESQPGQGSCFTLSLPVTVPVELAEPNVVTPATCQPCVDKKRGERPLSGLRILLAEDGRDNQVLITKVLRRAGAEVESALDGQAAVERLLNSDPSSARIDLVLMDMQMPKLDGYGATKQLREAGLDLPIIALTAHAMSGDRDACVAAGCSDYATKPVDFDLLVEMCAAHGKEAA